jgi:hypothetical protein
MFPAFRCVRGGLCLLLRQVDLAVAVPGLVRGIDLIIAGNGSLVISAKLPFLPKPLVSSMLLTVRHPSSGPANRYGNTLFPIDLFVAHITPPTSR